MHAVHHPFAYPLKPLTQASISRQPIPILQATRSNVLPYPGVPHPESFCAAISIRVSHTRNPSAPPFYPGVIHPESFCAAFLSGCYTPGILLCRHSIRMPHTRNPIRRCSTFSRCLASGILSGRRFTFFFILTALSLGSKITFLIKLCCHFHFWQAIFILPLFLKCFEISKESTSVIPNNGVIGIDSGKIKWALVGGPTYVNS